MAIIAGFDLDDLNPNFLISFSIVNIDEKKYGEVLVVVA